MGFRWKCVNCKNHDLCGNCHGICFAPNFFFIRPHLTYHYQQLTDAFLNGKLLHNNRRQTLSVRLIDHEFNVYTEKGSFESMMKTTSDAKKADTTAKKKKIKPNEKCPLCKSGKKYKKCCGRPGAAGKK
jgi:hypothetical protein